MTIGTVRVRGARGRVPALSTAVTGQLRAADLRPAAMPPSAVLIVRLLTDPLPGRLSARPGALRPDAKWQRSAQGRLDELFRRAAMPASGPVSPNAEAVRFADEAEMLAHFSLDLARGRWTSRWWWKALARGVASGDLTLLWARHARSLPAIVSHLAALGELPEVAKTLAPAGVKRVLEALVEAQGLDRLLLPHVGERGSATKPKTRGLRRAPVETVQAQGAAPPWTADLVGGDVRRLPAETHGLIAIALALHRTPTRARSRPFARAVHDWWPLASQASAELTTPTPPNIPAVRSQGREKDRNNEVEADRLMEEPIESAGREKSPAKLAMETAPRGNHKTASRRRRERQRARWTEELAAAPDTGSKGRAEEEPRRGKSGAEPRTDARPAEKRETTTSEPFRSSPPLRLEEGIFTELGGVLYLVNLIVHLDLLEELEELEESHPISAWHLLQLLAKALLAKAPLTKDTENARSTIRPPLPPRERAGVRVDSDGETSQDRKREVVDALPTLTPTLSLGGRGGQRRFARSDGGQSDDGQSDDGQSDDGHSDDDLLWTALAQLDDQSDEENPGNADAQRWLTARLPEIRQRLEEALGVEEESPEARTEAIVNLLRLDGQLHVSATHVDLVARLENVSLPARLAGLDLNPGWVPAFGRIFRFHFE